jgi:photosystem II stability/assembly factor-like uncharacterized protein
VTRNVQHARISDVKFLVCALLPFALTNARAADLTRAALSFTKLIGGNASDIGTAVATDSSGNVYVAGTTTSLDFPVLNPYQKQLRNTPFRASSDGGKTWTTPGITDPVYAVAGSPKASNVVYAGTTNAIYKSVDAGKTWTVLPAAGKGLVNALWVDPDTPSTVHAATSWGMAKSLDSGATWRYGLAGNMLALAVHPLKPSRLFAAANIGSYPTRPSLYRSTDGGVTWRLLQNSPPGPFTLTCDAANPDVVYAGVAQLGFDYSGSPTSLYRSDDGGDTWNKVSEPQLAGSTFAIAAGPTGLFAATTQGLLVSTDAGVSWKSTSVPSAADTVTVDPTRGQTVYANGDAGLFVSTDGGATWKSILPIRQLVETVAVAPTVPPTVFLGAGPVRDIFVTKWTGDGKQMLYSTYLGGSYLDYVTGLAVDRAGNAYVTGYTSSIDFPVTANAAQTRNPGTYNAFLAKIGPNGDTLPYSTYLGGSNVDAAFGIALDSAANVYLTGYTSSSDFPATPGALQTKLQQNCLPDSRARIPTSGDAFVAKIATDDGGLRYATFLGGSCADEGIGIAVDALGNAYVAGATTSGDLPVTPGSLHAPRGSTMTGFVAKVSPQGNALDYATYLGGTKSDSALAIAVDAKGAAYVTGTTWGFDDLAFRPTPVNASSGSAASSKNTVGFSVFDGGAAFVSKIDPSGSTRQFVKYLGGAWGEGTAITFDPAGNVWVAGHSDPRLSNDTYPTVHPFQASVGTGFVTQLAPDGSALLFSSMAESAQQVAVDTLGNAFVVGSSYAAKPTLPSASVTRIDGAVRSAMTLEAPQRIVPALNTSYVSLGVASGEIVVLAGDGLGPAQETGAKVGADGRIGTSLAGTTVTFDGLPAPLLSVQAQKIVCIVPFSLKAPGYTTTVQAQRDGTASNSILLPIASSSIEILSAVNPDGTVN